MEESRGARLRRNLDVLQGDLALARNCKEQLEEVAQAAGQFVAEQHRRMAQVRALCRRHHAKLCLIAGRGTRRSVAGGNDQELGRPAALGIAAHTRRRMRLWSRRWRSAALWRACVRPLPKRPRAMSNGVPSWQRRSSGWPS